MRNGKNQIPIRPKTFATKVVRRLGRLFDTKCCAMPPEKWVNLGVIGLGGAANWKLGEIVTCPKASLLSVCDVRPEAVDSVRKRYQVPHSCTDYRELLALDELDAVVISTPNALHCPISLAAFEAGKHVLCEKPLAIDADQAQAMCQAAELADRRAMVHFPYRLSAEAQFVRHLIADGQLGRLYHLSITYAQGGWYREDGSIEQRPEVGGWRTSRAMSGAGVISDLGSHALDLARFWMGEAESVSAVLAHQGRVEDSDAIDDGASYTIAYRSGALGTFVNSRCFTGRRQHFVAELYGSRGSLSFRPGRIDWYDRQIGRWFEVDVPPRFARSAIAEFCDSVLQSKNPVPSFEDGLRVQELLDAIVRASETKREVCLDCTDSIGSTATGNDEPQVILK